MRNENDKRFTIQNNDGTTTCGNHLLVVTLPTEEFSKIGRYGVFNDSMRMIGNRSEAALLESEPVSGEEIDTLATDIIRYEYLSEHCRYNLAETMMRMNGGHRMSEGMAADVAVAAAHARMVMADAEWSKKYRDDALEILERDRQSELRRRSAIGKTCSGWKIEIIGQMPEQIGLCRVAK